MGKKRAPPGPSHRFFDHTGDSGVDLQAGSLEELAAEVARAFLELLTDAPDAVGEREAVAVQVSGVDEADLLVALGNELIYRFEVDKLLCARLEVTRLAPGALEAVLHGERYDPARHPIARPIKAITHHEAGCARARGRWRARLVFDL